MANHYSALKRVRQIERRTAINGMKKTLLRHTIRAIRRKLDANDLSGAEELLPRTYSVIDRSAKRGLIKANTASRYKSRIAARLRKAQQAA